MIDWNIPRTQYYVNHEVGLLLDHSSLILVFAYWAANSRLHGGVLEAYSAQNFAWLLTEISWKKTA
jgi:hypothetical protein